jgi:hypothetical protein
MRHNFVCINHEVSEMWININNIVRIAIVGNEFVYVDFVNGAKMCFEPSKAEELLNAIRVSDSVALHQSSNKGGNA